MLSRIETNDFLAKDDSGKEYIITVQRKVITTMTLTNPRDEACYTSMFLADGTPVERIGNSTDYRISTTGVIVHFVKLI